MRLSSRPDVKFEGCVLCVHFDATAGGQSEHGVVSVHWQKLKERRDLTRRRAVSANRLTEPADALGLPEPPLWSRGLMRLIKRVIAVSTATAAFGLYLAPTSPADSTSQLKNEIDAARSEAGCPPLQTEPILTDASQRIAEQASAWVNHTARELPVADYADRAITLHPDGPRTIQSFLRELGYNPAELRLLQGYADHTTGGRRNASADNETKAIKGAVLEGKALDVFANCRYVKYGLATINDDGSQGWPSTVPKSYSITAVIVASA